jgi:hypothetical protein
MSVGGGSVRQIRIRVVIRHPPSRFPNSELQKLQCYDLEVGQISTADNYLLIWRLTFRKIDEETLGDLNLEDYH